MSDDDGQERFDAIRDEAAEKIARTTLEREGIAMVVADAMRRAVELDREGRGEADG